MTGQDFRALELIDAVVYVKAHTTANQVLIVLFTVHLRNVKISAVSEKISIAKKKVLVTLGHR